MAIKSFDELINEPTSNIKSFDELIVEIPESAQPKTQEFKPISDELATEIATAQPQDPSGFSSSILREATRSDNYKAFKAAWEEERENISQNKGIRWGAANAWNNLVAEPLYKGSKATLGMFAATPVGAPTTISKLIDPSKGTNPLTIDVNPPTTAGGAIVDTSNKLVGFALQLFLLKKATGLEGAKLWELQNTLAGGKPGMGAANYTAMSAPGKILGGVKAVSMAGKIAKEAGTIAMESTALTGISAIEQKIDTGEVDWKPTIAFNVALPLMFRTPGFIKAGMRLRSNILVDKLVKTNEPSSKIWNTLPNQRQMMANAIESGKLNEYLIDTKASQLYDELLSAGEAGNTKSYKTLSKLIQGQSLPKLDDLYSRVQEGDKMAVSMIQDGIYAGSPESFIEGLRVQAAAALGLDYIPKTTRTKFEYVRNRNKLKLAQTLAKTNIEDRDADALARLAKRLDVDIIGTASKNKIIAKIKAAARQIEEESSLTPTTEVKTVSSEQRPLGTGTKLPFTPNTVDVMKVNVDRYGINKLPEMFNEWKKSPEVQKEFAGLTKDINNKNLEPTLWETFNRELYQKIKSQEPSSNIGELPFLSKRTPVKPKASAGIISPEVELEELNIKMRDWAKSTKMVRKEEVAEELHKLRGRQYGRAVGIFKYERAKGASIFEAVKAARAGQSIQAKQFTVEPPNLTKSEWEIYGKKIEQVFPVTKGKLFDAFNATNALGKVKSGNVPTLSEFGLLERVFGKETTLEIFKATQEKTKRSLADYIGWGIGAWKIPFAFGPQSLHQFAGTSSRHPVIATKALVRNILGMVSKNYRTKLEKQYVGSYTEILAKDGYGVNLLQNVPWAKDYRLEQLKHITPLADAMANVKGKKGIGLRFVGKWLNASSESADIAINMGLGDLVNQSEKELQNLVGTKTRAGKAMTEAQISTWRLKRGKDINVLTKRIVAKTRSGKDLQRAANLVIFSPAYFAARPMAAGKGVVNIFRSGTLSERTYIMQNIGALLLKIQAVSAVVALVGHKERMQDPTQEPTIDSSTNPMDSLWGKGRIGKDVYDFTFGEGGFYRSLFQLGAGAYLAGQQIITGNKRTTIKDVISPAIGMDSREYKVPATGDVIERYFTTKETPLYGFAKELTTGKDWLGRDIEYKDFILEHIPMQWLQSFVQAGVEDGVWETLLSGDVRESSLTMIENIPVAAAGLLEIPTQSYPVPTTTTRAKYKDSIANEAYKKNWNDLNIQQQRELLSKNVDQFKEYEATIKEERYEDQKDTISLEEQKKSDKNIRELISDKNQEKIKGISIGVKRTKDEFYLNDKRFQKYQELMAKYLNTMLRGINVETMPDDVRRKIVTKFKESAQNRAFAEVSQGETTND